MEPATSEEEQIKVMTLEAFADTIVPGNKRWPGDRAVAGVSSDGGSVAAGAMELLESPAGGLSQWLGGLAGMLNGHAQNYAGEQGIELDDTVPAFVSLDYDDRVALVLRLTAWEHPERQGWVNLVMFSNMAWDTGAHMHTVDALAAGHPGPAHPGLRATGRRRPVAVPQLHLRPAARRDPPEHHALREPRMTSTESTDVLVIGSGFGGSIAAYHLAAGGARVTVLERGPWLEAEDYDQDFKLGSSSTRIFEFTVGDGMSVLGGNCVGGGSVVYFATMPRAPRYIFERQGSIGRRMWPAAISRDSLEPWYDRVAEALPISKQKWETVPYAGGVWAAACNNAGHTCNPVPAAVDTAQVHQLQLDDVGLQVRRQALAAAELPAGRDRARRRDPAAARGAADHPELRRRLPGALQHPGRGRLPGADRQRHHRRQADRAGRRHRGHPGHPAALGAAAGHDARTRSAGTSPATVNGSTPPC